MHQHFHNSGRGEEGRESGPLPATDDLITSSIGFFSFLGLPLFFGAFTCAQTPPLPPFNACTALRSSTRADLASLILPQPSQCSK